MRRLSIGIAAIFLIASAFGALAAAENTQGKTSRGHMMHHKSMTYGGERHRAGYRHGGYRTGMYHHAGTRRRYGRHHRVEHIYGARGRHYRSARYGHGRTAMHHGTMMQHKASKTQGTKKASATRKGTKTKPSAH